MTFFELALEYPALSTTRVKVAEEAPVTGPFQGGVVLDLGLVRWGAVTLTTTVSGRGFGAEWEGNFPMSVSVWSLGADIGARFAPGEPEGRVVNSWFGVGYGIRGEYVSAPYWEDVVTGGVGIWTGGGAVVGTGPVRASFAVRADVSLRVDAWNGTVVTSEGTTTWSYYPGNAKILFQAGAHFQ